MPRSNRQKSRKRSRIKIIHNAPGKKGKQEVRFVRTAEEAVAYFERNEKRLGKGRQSEKGLATASQ